MSQPKGKVPSHIKKKEFHHPKEDNPLIQVLIAVPDPRQPSCNFRHSLVSMLFISLVGVLCGAKDWEEIEQCAEGMIDWIGTYVDVSNGIPSSKTLKRVMSIISEKTLNMILQGLKTAIADHKGDVIAIDGKTMRGCRGWDKKDPPLHLLHAWSTEHGICLGQLSVDRKSNEITAFPELIDSLEIKGSIVTADALNTQKKSVKAITQKGADYILPVKKNHKDLYNDIQLLFREADKREFKGVDAAQSYTLEKSAGRVEERFYDMIDLEDLAVKNEWVGCNSVGRVVRKRTESEKTSKEECFYITSLDLDIKNFSRGTRGYWGIENGLHRALDVIFREDQHRYQDRVGAANLSLLRKTALTILTRDSTLKCGRSAKQMRAATSPSYRDHLIKNCF